jgi:hypothetical protein
VNTGAVDDAVTPAGVIQTSGDERSCTAPVRLGVYATLMIAAERLRRRNPLRPHSVAGRTVTACGCGNHGSGDEVPATTSRRKV